MSNFVRITALAVLCACAVSCRTSAVIADDATAAQLIQAGQEALEVSNYSVAEEYYTAVIQRYGMDTATYVEARYELGHLYMKRKKYEQAYRSFSEILGIFENAEYGTVPPAYKKLSQMEIAKIPAKYLPQAEDE